MRKTCVCDRQRLFCALGLQNSFHPTIRCLTGRASLAGGGKEKSWRLSNVSETFISFVVCFESVCCSCRNKPKIYCDDGWSEVFHDDLWTGWEREAEKKLSLFAPGLHEAIAPASVQKVSASKCRRHVFSFLFFPMRHTTPRHNRGRSMWRQQKQIKITELKRISFAPCVLSSVINSSRDGWEEKTALPSFSLSL